MAIPKNYALAMIILMHEPTDELFLGVMHPDAALFADYFDWGLTHRPSM